MARQVCPIPRLIITTIVFLTLNYRESAQAIVSQTDKNQASDTNIFNSRLRERRDADEFGMNLGGTSSQEPNILATFRRGDGDNYGAFARRDSPEFRNQSPPNWNTFRDLDIDKPQTSAELDHPPRPTRPRTSHQDENGSRPRLPNISQWPHRSAAFSGLLERQAGQEVGRRARGERVEDNSTAMTHEQRVEAGLARLEDSVDRLVTGFLALQRSVFNLEQLQELLVLLLEDLLKETGIINGSTEPGRGLARGGSSSSGSGEEDSGDADNIEDDLNDGREAFLAQAENDYTRAGGSNRTPHGEHQREAGMRDVQEGREGVTRMLDRTEEAVQEEARTEEGEKRRMTQRKGASDLTRPRKRTSRDSSEEEEREETGETNQSSEEEDAASVQEFDQSDELSSETEDRFDNQTNPPTAFPTEFTTTDTEMNFNREPWFEKIVGESAAAPSRKVLQERLRSRFNHLVQRVAARLSNSLLASQHTIAATGARTSQNSGSLSSNELRRFSNTRVQDLEPTSSEAMTDFPDSLFPRFSHSAGKRSDSARNRLPASNNQLGPESPHDPPPLFMFEPLVISPASAESDGTSRHGPSRINRAVHDIADITQTVEVKLRRQAKESTPARHGKSLPMTGEYNSQRNLGGRGHNPTAKADKAAKLPLAASPQVLPENNKTLQAREHGTVLSDGTYHGSKPSDYQQKIQKLTNDVGQREVRAEISGIDFIKSGSKKSIGVIPQVVNLTHSNHQQLDKVSSRSSSSASRDNANNSSQLGLPFGPSDHLQLEKITRTNHNDTSSSPDSPDYDHTVGQLLQDLSTRLNNYYLKQQTKLSETRGSSMTPKVGDSGRDNGNGNTTLLAGESSNNTNGNDLRDRLLTELDKLVWLSRPGTDGGGFEPVFAGDAHGESARATAAMMNVEEASPKAILSEDQTLREEGKRDHSRQTAKNDNNNNNNINNTIKSIVSLAKSADVTPAPNTSFDSNNTVGVRDEGEATRLSEDGDSGRNEWLWLRDVFLRAEGGQSVDLEWLISTLAKMATIAELSDDLKVLSDHGSSLATKMNLRGKEGRAYGETRTRPSLTNDTRTQNENFENSTQEHNFTTQELNAMNETSNLSGKFITSINSPTFDSDRHENRYVSIDNDKSVENDNTFNDNADSDSASVENVAIDDNDNGDVSDDDNDIDDDDDSDDDNDKDDDEKYVTDYSEEKIDDIDDNVHGDDNHEEVHDSGKPKPYVERKIDYLVSSSASDEDSAESEVQDQETLDENKAKSRIDDSVKAVISTGPTESQSSNKETNISKHRATYSKTVRSGSRDDDLRSRISAEMTRSRPFKRNELLRAIHQPQIYLQEIDSRIRNSQMARERSEAKPLERQNVRSRRQLSDILNLKKTDDINNESGNAHRQKRQAFSDFGQLLNPEGAQHFLAMPPHTVGTDYMNPDRSFHSQQTLHAIRQRDHLVQKAPIDQTNTHNNMFNALVSPLISSTTTSIGDTKAHQNLPKTFDRQFISQPGSVAQAANTNPTQNRHMRNANNPYSQIKSHQSNQLRDISQVVDFALGYQNTMLNQPDTSWTISNQEQMASPQRPPSTQIHKPSSYYGENNSNYKSHAQSHDPSLSYNASPHQPSNPNYFHNSRTDTSQQYNSNNNRDPLRHHNRNLYPPASSDTNNSPYHQRSNFNQGSYGQERPSVQYPIGGFSNYLNQLGVHFPDVGFIGGPSVFGNPTEPGELPSFDPEEILNNIFTRYWQRVNNIYNPQGPPTTTTMEPGEYEGEIITAPAATTTTMKSPPPPTTTTTTTMTTATTTTAAATTTPLLEATLAKLLSTNAMSPRPTAAYKSLPPSSPPSTAPYDLLAGGASTPLSATAQVPVPRTPLTISEQVQVLSATEPLSPNIPSIPQQELVSPDTQNV